MAKRKWRVLIVDDEFRIGMLIQKLVRWEELSMECVAVLDNGEAAFSKIREECPDIVVTDIRMPKINGLDLICMARELDSDIKFIVVSGYKEFEYAHKALQYGVDDYLLKPINQEELNQVLAKIQKELLQKEEQSVEELQLRRVVSESRQIIKRDFLKNIIEAEDGQIPEDSRVLLEGECYRGIDIKLDYVDYNKSDEKQDKLTAEKILSIVEGILTPLAEEVLICEKENLHIYCVFNYHAENARAVKNSLNDILSEIKEALLGFEQYEVTIGVSMEKKAFSEIRFSIKEAYRAVLNRVKLGTGRLIYADGIPGREEAPDLGEAFLEKLLSALEVYSRIRLEQCLNDMYSAYVFEAELDFSGCYEATEQVINLFFEHMEMISEESRQLQKKLLNHCQHCYSIRQMKALLKEELGGYLEMAKAAVESESVKPIRQAKQYIAKHYSEKIVLEDIAEVVGLNSVYFSVLFKKETGMNFSAYLVNVRMEKAREMICNTNETIAAIAECVGYKDSRYFSQIFTKVVGIKPALYRKLHS